MEEYLDIFELSGVTKKHIKEVRRFLENYLEGIENKVEKTTSIYYFKQLQDRYSVSSYRKQLYQLLKFLNHFHVEWISEIKPPADPIYYPKRISKKDIDDTLHRLKDCKHFKQAKAIILLSTSSGMRPKEIYQIKREDIDIENRVVHINHNPDNGQSTKTKRSRVTFFNEEAQKALCEYLEVFDNNNFMSTLFSQTHIKRLFTNAPVRVKELRKFFSQEWDRRGGPTSIKKILMGHSMRNDVDLMHYNAQSPDDLKRIYDKVNI